MKKSRPTNILETETDLLLLEDIILSGFDEINARGTPICLLQIDNDKSFPTYVSLLHARDAEAPEKLPKALDLWLLITDNDAIRQKWLDSPIIGRDRIEERVKSQISEKLISKEYELPHPDLFSYLDGSWDYDQIEESEFKTRNRNIRDEEEKERAASVRAIAEARAAASSSGRTFIDDDDLF
jgi:hypothetical protein